MPRQSTAWLLVELAVFLVFGTGAIANLVFWVRAASPPNQPSEFEVETGFDLAGVAALTQPRVLGRLLLEVLLQWRLRRVSQSRWLAHLLLFWGNVILFFVGSLGLMLAEKGLLPITKDTPWFAVVNETAGLMVLLGVAMSILRYYRVAEPRAITSGAGLLWLVWLGAVALSGYTLEAARLASEQVAATTGAYAFVGYPLARALTALLPAWSGVYPVLWWLHAGAAMVLVASVPYGRLFHMFASPLAIAVNLSRSAQVSPRDSAPAIGGEEAVLVRRPS